jgi:LysR family transcriptional activator of glutamate synthase operon
MEILETRQLLAFKTIVETGGFTKAARQLHLTQSALSHQIKSLETQLRTPVFARLGKRVVLTQAGEVLLRYTAPALQQLLEAQQEIATLHEPGHGRLRVSAATFTCYQILPHVLREFRVSFPHVELLVAAEYTDKAVQGLLSGELDLGIFVQPHSTDGLHIEPLSQDELVVIVSPQHPWARRRHVQWTDLATQVLITYNRASETFQMVQRELHNRGITTQETMEVRHGAAVMEMVKVGLGVALIPLWVVREDVQAGSLRGLPLGRGGLKRQWVIAHAKGAPLAAYDTAFIQLCHKWFPRLMTDTALAPALAATAT